MLDSHDKQKTISYWASEGKSITEALPELKQSSPPNNQTPKVLEGESLSSSSIPISADKTPTVPNLADVQQSQNPPAQNDLIQIKEKLPESCPPVVPTITDEQWPQSSTEKDCLWLTRNSDSDSQISNIENDQSTPLESEQFDVSSQPENYQQGVNDREPDQGDLVRQSELADLEQVRYDQVMTGWDPIPQIAGQKRRYSPEPEIEKTRQELVEQDEPEYDKVMTGWDPIPPLAGQKRNHSPDAPTTRSKRGRSIQKVDYYSLHHGKVAKPSSDPKTWSEAMQCSEAPKWQKAANEE